MRLKVLKGSLRPAVHDGNLDAELKKTYLLIRIVEYHRFVRPCLALSILRLPSACNLGTITPAIFYIKTYPDCSWVFLSSSIRRSPSSNISMNMPSTGAVFSFSDNDW